MITRHEISKYDLYNIVYDVLRELRPDMTVGEIGAYATAQAEKIEQDANRNFAMKGTDND